MKIEDVAIVSGFIDVFPSEIASMLPARAFEFTIELNPETTPTNDLIRTQLQELFR